MRDLAAKYNGRALRTEAAQAVFEEHAETELSDFFDYWVHGGYLPNIDVTVHLDETTTRVEGCVQTDVPFGTFVLPIRAGQEDVFVSVQDGVGHFRHPDATARRGGLAPADIPVMNACDITLAKLPMPTAARAASPSDPTIAVSMR
ncbi:MAG: hypothetical protein AAFV53_19750 [Myxococcota bacterium]